MGAGAELVVVTWNVLHRIHAVNWDEPVIRAWPAERARSASIAALLGQLAADVICLQEVSGDQLAAVRAREPGAVFAFRYPRVPSYYQHAEPTPPDDPAEYLVTIVRGRPAHAVHAEAFPTDPGKGYQHVELAPGITLINTHVSEGDRHAAQCTWLADEARAAPGLAIVCGDFNADREACIAHLGSGLAVAIPAAPALPTRPRPQPSAKSETIDHVFVHGGTVVEARVLDAGGRSDHNPVRARITPLGPLAR